MSGRHVVPPRYCAKKGGRSAAGEARPTAMLSRKAYAVRHDAAARRFTWRVALRAMRACKIAAQVCAGSALQRQRQVAAVIVGEAQAYSRIYIQATCRSEGSAGAVARQECVRRR